MGIVDNALIGASGQGGYFLSRSLRFRSSATANLTRTFSSAGNRRTWTWSGWVKLGLISSSRSVFAANAAASNIAFDTNNGSYEIAVDGVYNGTRTLRYTAALYRDPAAWYHVVVALDTTQATDTNRIKLYVNGAQVSLTNVAVGSWPAQNSEGSINNNIQHCIGQRIFTTDYNFDGYLTEVNFIDGQALTPSSFGSTNTLTGVWQPARYTGTYGTNGFYLPFTDNSALTTSSNVGLGKDFSGNGNYFTTNNISITAGVTYDSMTDVPTLTSATAANFAVLNPLDYSSSGTITDTNGNLTVSGSGAAYGFYRSTLAILTKTYFEVFCTSVGSGGTYIGVAIATGTISGTGICYYNGANGSVYLNGSIVATYATFTTNDIVGVTYDPATASVSFYKNNSLQGSVSTSFSGNVFAMVGDGSSLTVTLDANFGQRPFAYTPPTGFVALNTYNLPTSTIVKGNTVMDATLYTGNGGTLAVANAAGFKPDLVWIKARSNAYWHALTDSVRGTTKLLSSNVTNAEATYTDELTSFNSNGFTLGASTNGFTNYFNGTTYVGWQWQAGQGTTSTNTSGTITSTVSVNASAGFSVVTWTANASANQSIGHGLGVAPQLIIVKDRTTVINWNVWFTGFTANEYLLLNSTAAKASFSTLWYQVPDSSKFYVGSTATAANYQSGDAYVAYCWTPIAGYSAMGSFTGNGSSDGVFVYTGFQPKWVLVKKTSATDDWVLFDSVRSPYNVVNNWLLPNSSGAELTSAGSPDILSNGFKMRSTSGATNASGATYIYIAFATNPFKNSLAR